MDKENRSLPQASMVPKEATNNSGEGLSISENGLPSASYGSSSASASYGLRQDSEGFDIQRLFAIVARRWPVMLGVFLVVLFLGVFNLLRAKPIYESSAILEFIPTQRSSSDSESIPGMQAFSQGTTADMIATQLENLRSGSLFTRSMATLPPAQRQTLSAMAAVNVNQTESTRLATVDIQSYDPNASAALANAICKAFIADSLQKNRANTQGAIVYIEDQLSSVRQRLAHAQARLKLFKQKTGIFDLSARAESMGAASADIEKDLQSATADRAALQSRLKGLQGLLSKLPAGKVVPSGLIKNPAIVELQTQLTAKELERSKALREYMPGSTYVTGIDSDIKAIHEQLQQAAQTIVSAWQPDPSRIPLATDAASTQAELWSLDSRITALQKQDADATKNLKQLPEQEFQFSQLNIDAQVLQQTYQMLTQQLQTMRIQEVGSTADARLTSEAGPNPNPVAPDKKHLMIYTIGLGLLAAMCVGLVLDLMDNHLYTEDDVHQTTGLPVLVHVPMFRQSTELNLLKAGDNKTERSLPLLETFRMLRTNIRLSVIDKPVRSLMVTSSLPNEGKSHTALNLAVAAANSGDRVALIDLDLRRPSVHKLCNVSNAKGFTSVVTNQCSLSEALQDTEVPGLQLLTSGPTPPNTFKLLNSQTARSLVDQITREFDLVIIDTPPVLVIADALLISSWVDGSLLVISSSEIKKKEVARTVDTLLQNNAEVLGTVLTKVSTAMDGYYPYYGYSEYFEQKNEEEEIKSLPATN